MKKKLPVTKHLVHKYYDLAKEKITNDRICAEYALKFIRCKNDIAVNTFCC